MDANNLIFILLISMLLFTGTGIIITDAARSAPVPYTNVTVSLNTSTLQMSQLLNRSTAQATAPQLNENVLDIALGYLKGGYNAVITFVGMLDISQNMVTQLALTSGFIPIQFVLIIQIALFAVFFIGILYYWFKVK